MRERKKEEKEKTRKYRVRKRWGESPRERKKGCGDRGKGWQECKQENHV